MTETRNVMNLSSQDFYCYAHDGAIVEFKGRNQKRLPEPQSGIVLVVDKETLTRAIAAGRTTFDLAEICGQSLGRGGVQIYNIQMCDLAVSKKTSERQHERVYPLASCADCVTNL